MKKTKLITVSAMLSALGTAILAVASVFDVADITISMVASAIIVFSMIELGTRPSFMIYAATATLSLILLPRKYIALIYIAFCGLYPIIKFRIDSLPKPLAIFVKLLYFNVALTVAVIAARFVFDTAIYTEWLLVGYYLLANFAFILFDILIKKGTDVYFVKFRDKVRRLLK